MTNKLQATDKLSGYLVQNGEEPVANFSVDVSEQLEEEGLGGFVTLQNAQYEGTIPNVRGGLKPLKYTLSDESQYNLNPNTSKTIGLQLNEGTGQVTGVPTQV